MLTLARMAAGLTLAAAALAQTPVVHWYEQIPPLARGGQTVRFRVRADNATRLVLAPVGGGETRAFSAAGPGLFETDFVVPAYEPRFINLRINVAQARVFQAETQALAINLSVRYSDALPPVRITPLAADVQRSDYIINVHSRAFYDGLITDGRLTFRVEPLATRMYQLLGDDYDFLNVISASVSCIANRGHSNLRNSVTGIGLPNLNAAGSFGSARRLLGYSMFPNLSFYDGADAGYNHETAHQWISAIANGPFAIGRPHWPISSMATGIMGFSDPINRQGLGFPCRFTPREDGSVVVQQGSLIANRFGDFDLYLMGLLDASEIRDPQYVVTDAGKAEAATRQSCAGAGTLSPGQFQTVTINDLITAAGGPRQPNAAASQKEFRLVHLAVSRDGLLSREEMAHLEMMARRSEDRALVPSSGGSGGSYVPWFEATRRRSTLVSRISNDTGPVITTGSVVNAASFSPAAVGPSAVASLFGSALATGTASAAAVPLPTSLGGVRVLVNGSPAPLFYVSPTQINLQMPDGVSTTPAIQGEQSNIAILRVERDGMASNNAYAEIRPRGPGIITYGDNYAVAVKTDGTVVGPDNPAAPGSVVTIYWTGAAPLSETVPAGTAAPLDRLIRVEGLTAVSVGGLPQGVTFIGLTPGGVGLFQANVALSSNLPNGDLPVLFNFAGAVSNSPRISVRR